MKQWIIWIIAAIVVVGGLYWWWNSHAGTSAVSGDGTSLQQNATGDSQSNASTTDIAATSTSEASSSVTVTYNGVAFSPSTVAIPQGGSVTFVDQSGSPMWVASDPHPVHTGYDGTSRQTHCAAGYQGPAPFDQCKATTDSFTFTFTKVGSWGYHDHVNDSAHGTVVVQ